LRAAFGVCALVFLALPRHALAEQGLAEQRDEPTPSTPLDPVRESARAGSFLPLTLPASVDRARGFAAGYGGYDSAARSPRVMSFGEAHVYGPLALRIGAQSNTATQKVAPSIAARLGFLSERKHGLDAALSLAYNAEGFTELEGELEVVLALGKSVGNWQLLTNLAYGQDPEGHERDAEFRAAALCRLGSLTYLGLDGRGRINLSPDTDTARAHDDPLYDIDAGPALNLALGPIVIGAHGGLSALQQREQSARFGVVALAGLGSAL
jgi:hypothetical protein